MNKWNKPIRSDELFHFGVKGQKWGVRRYQNSDGTLTSEGRKRMKAEIKEDNKKAFEAGKHATVAASTLKYAEKRSDKKIKAYEKAEEKGSSSVARKYRDAVVAKNAADAIRMSYEKYEKEAKNLEKSLIKKYGQENVNGLKYDKNGKINERVVTGKEVVGSALVTAGSVGMMSAGLSPVGIIMTPAGKNQRGRTVAKQAYTAGKAVMKETIGSPETLYYKDYDRSMLYRTDWR